MKKIVSCILAMMLVVFAAIPVFAADVKSPEGFKKYKVTINQTVGGIGNYEFKSEINDAGEQEVHLYVTVDDNYSFDHWTIEGSYKALGSLKDSVLDIIITSDVTVTPYFVKSDGTTDPTQAGTTVVINKDTSPSSPQTGRNDAPVYVLILFALAACSIATVKFVKSK